MSVNIEKAILHLEGGGIVVYPTDTLWGIGCNALNENGVKRLIKIKGKIEGGMSVIIPKIETVKKICEVSERDEKILRDNLPGPFTFIMKVKSKFPKGVCRNERIGIRIPNNKTALKLSAKFPIISTSANKHGEATVKNIKEAKEIFGNEILYLEGEEPLGFQSTIINLDEGEVEVIRKGMGYLKQTEA